MSRSKIYFDNAIARKRLNLFNKCMGDMVYVKMFFDQMNIFRDEKTKLKIKSCDSSIPGMGDLFSVFLQVQRLNFDKYRKI